MAQGIGAPGPDCPRHPSLLPQVNSCLPCQHLRGCKQHKIELRMDTCLEVETRVEVICSTAEKGMTWQRAGIDPGQGAGSGPRDEVLPGCRERRPSRSDAPWHVSSVLSSVVSKEADGGLTFPGWLQDKQGVGSKCHVVSSVLDVRVMPTRAWGWAGIWQRWIT